ncbi:MAG: glycoside hydrolase family 32 protein [Actinomycetaceae bacterium]|nr:glycoside hydrolase family 32 protein [Actinomycetaceae bacterium]
MTTEDLSALAADAVARSSATTDPDFPRVHVAPPVGRLNDPNGLIQIGDTYHAFYQFSPLHPRKLVYWGHATSTDLTHWTHHDPAIIPDAPFDANGAYSGTAIATDSGVELWYTGNLKDDEGTRYASQCVVTTADMTHFVKEMTPVIPTHPQGYTAHFRDPQVWRDTDGSYRMLIGVQRENLTGAALLYRSTDRREWTLEGEMTFPDANGAFDDFGYMWECPNLVRVRDEDTNEWHDVFIFCPQGIEPDKEGYENIFPCVYIVGHLVGTEFRGANGTFEEVDRGFEFYAPQVFARPLDSTEDALLLGWAGNASEDDQPSIGSGNWVHCLTAPRRLTLKNGRLRQRFDLPGLSLEAFDGDLPVGDRGVDIDVPSTWRLSLEARFESSNAALVFEVGHEKALQIRVTPDYLEVDRSATRYPHGDVRRVSLPTGAADRIDILHDRSITEIVLGNGQIAFTLRSFLPGDNAGLSITRQGNVRLENSQLARGTD